MKSGSSQVRIFDEQGRIRGSGVAEEFREASRINQTSAMENPKHLVWKGFGIYGIWW